MRTLVTDPVVADSISVTHTPAVRELLQLRAGAELRWDGREADHHIIVMTGTCRVLDRQIHAGASAYVPAGMAHTLRAGAWGCTVLSVDTATVTV
jgi:hypothetical protein